MKALKPICLVLFIFFAGVAWVGPGSAAAQTAAEEAAAEAMAEVMQDIKEENKENIKEETNKETREIVQEDTATPEVRDTGEFCTFEDDCQSTGSSGP